MTEPMHSPLAEDDFRPTDQLGPDGGRVPISVDFVARTFARVQQDQRRIRDEAARVDAVTLPRTLLDRYEAPPPSPDFVDRTLGRIAAATAAPEAVLQRALAAWRAPEVSADFVQRTLDALRFEDAMRFDRPRPGPRPLPRPQPAASARPRILPLGRRAAAIAAVALVTAVLALAMRGGRSAAPRLDALPQVAAATEFSPAVLNTVMERRDAGPHSGLRIEPPDPLLVLATAAEGRGE